MSQDLKKRGIQHAALNGELVDYVAECRADVGIEATIEQFMQAFCSRCLRSECHRSSYHGLSWAHRMRRQEEGLNSPIFLPSDDPRYREHASQNFESFAKRQVRVQNWDSFEGARDPVYLEPKRPEPEPEPEHKPEYKSTRRVVHNNNLPWEEVKTVEDGAAKVEPALASPPEPRAEPRAEPREEAPVTTPSTQERPARKQMTYNTPMPEGGIMLPGAPPKAKAQPKATGDAKIIANDPWAVPTSPEEAAQRKEKGRSTLKVKLTGTKKPKDT